MLIVYDVLRDAFENNKVHCYVVFDIWRIKYEIYGYLCEKTSLRG